MDNINGSLFVDFKQAFDTIDHDILIKKLSFYGLSCSTLHLLQSFLSDRVQSVSFNNNISKASLIRRGVPQGSILGPLLFSIYINDLPDYVSFGNCEMFAYDTSIHVSDSKLANVINKLELSGK
ncbi:RNA-directed DNA polymerase from mobile element jockey-like protein [Plakobranchus ocellatus]|uniref:RNA-directed DNA polymerase from mobile element jockey-like protein n=1 Tax=Plakobranchus ocellatus TaxID=259542 RepID=A0AAV4DQM5_9GAST|nr:RNA-directed DNA polymerase from mobile element jockey-like protein [Plakobranchus ocellatus]